MTETTLSFAKTSQPTLSLVIRREDVFRAIDTATGGPAVWITGPPGSGKTTTIASYLNARKQPALWYQVDSADADPATFLHYLRRTAVKHGDERLAELPELPVGSEDWTGFAKRLLREVYAGFKGSLMIVLDNYDALPAYTELHEILSACVDEVPRQSKLIFVSRTASPPAFARNHVNGQFTEIDGYDLKLSIDEFKEIAQMRHSNLAPDVLEMIHSASSGWMAGCIVMLEYARGDRRFGGEIADGSGSVMFDYVAQEVFSTFDATTRDFLIRVCWPRQLSLPLAEAISGESTAQQILTNLARNNYFVTERTDGTEREYILHPLLREFLQAQAREILGSNRVNETRQTSAKLLAAAGHPEEAVELLAENLDWESLESVISDNAELLIRQGRVSTIANWLEELPPDRLEKNPWLLYWYGKSKQQESARDARNYLARAYRSFSCADPVNRTGMILAATGAIEAIIDEADDYSLLDDWVSTLDALIDSKPEDDVLQHTPAVVLIAALLRNPKHFDADKWFRWSEGMLENIKDAAGRKHYAVMLTLARMLAGQLDWAEDLMAQHHTAFSQDVQSGDGCKLLLMSSAIALLRSSQDKQSVTATESLDLLNKDSAATLQGLKSGVLCAAALINKDLETADLFLKEIESMTTPANRLFVFLNSYLGSWRMLIEYDKLEALRLQRRAQKASAELGIVFFEILSSTACAQLLFLCGDKRAGASQLRRVHSIARDVRNPLLEFMTLLIYSSVAIDSGRKTSGNNALRYALGLGRQHSFYAIPWWNPEHLANICAIALQERIETKYVQGLIIRRKLQPTEPPLDIRDWPWTLSVTTFGGFGVRKLGELDAQLSRGRGRPLLLLITLVALGGQEVSARELGKVLWPHVEDEYAEKSLTVNLHRLRRLLGCDGAIVFSNGMLSLDPQLVSIDCQALEAVVDKIESQLSDVRARLNRSEIENFGQRLLDVYRGPFLPDLTDQPSIAVARSRYRKIFSKGICLIIQSLESSDCRDSAIKLAESALALDSSAEMLGRNLVRMFRDSGQVEDALELFERCREAWDRDPEVSMSEAATALYVELKRMTGSLDRHVRNDPPDASRSRK